MPRPRRFTAPTLLALIAAAVALGSCSSGHARPEASTPSSSAVSAPTSSTTATTIGPTTTTTVDPGSLPQTDQLPSGTDPQFLARMSQLVQAVSTGNAALAAPAFFPLSAYVQVKGISDPVHDYQTRLIADYDQDIAALHSEFASAPGALTLDHVAVPAAAEWIRPGVEYNKGSYWRVYGTRLSLTSGGRVYSFPIASLISWRGQWYVVHLNSIR
jgi:hypothetical protein